MIQTEVIPYADYQKEHNYQLRLPFCAIDFETWRDFDNPNICSFLIAVKEGPITQHITGATITGKTDSGKLTYKENPDGWKWNRCDKHQKTKNTKSMTKCKNCHKEKPKNYGKYFTKTNTDEAQVKVIKGWCWADEIETVLIPQVVENKIFKCYAHNATVDIIAMLNCLLPDLAHPLQHFAQNPDERGKLLLRGSKILSAPIDIAPNINKHQKEPFSRMAYNHKSKKMEKHTDYPLKFIDSVALMPLPLASIGEACGFPKGKTPEIFTNAEHPNFGNYMAIKDADIAYAVRDCEVLWKGMRQFWNTIKEIGYAGKALPLTSGTLGIQMIAQSNVEECKDDKTKVLLYRKKPKSWKYESIVNQPAWDDICRKALVGGRTQVFNTHKVGNGTKAYGSDANAMYPSVLTNEANTFPDFRTMFQIKDPSQITEQMITNQEGCIHVAWERPAWDKVGLFAHKPTGKGLDWTQEQGVRWITLNEYRYAQSKGYKLTITVDEEDDCCAIICERLKYNPFLCVKRWYEKRLEMKKANDPSQFIIKILMNAGSFGKHVEKNQSQIITTEDEYGMSSLTDWDFSGVAEVNGEVFGYAKDQEYKRSDTTANIMGCYITAYARIDLYEVIQEVGIEHMLYTDTDSAKHTNPSIKCPKEGEGLCEWKLEQVYDFWHSVAPKQYKYHAIWDEDKGDCDKWSARIKGCSLKSAAGLEDIDYETFCKNIDLEGSVRFERVVGLKESWRSNEHGAGQWIIQEKDIGKNKKKKEVAKGKGD